MRKAEFMLSGGTAFQESLLVADHHVHPKEGGHGLGVADLVACHHAEGLRKREEFKSDLLVLFWLGFTQGEPAGKEYVHGFVEEPGAGVELEDACPLFGYDSGLFH